MKKIADNFNGYLKIDDDTFTYSVTDHVVTLLPATSEETDKSVVSRRIHSRGIDKPEFLFGNDNHSETAMLCNKLNVDVLRLSPAIRFAAPIIIKASGNTTYFSSELTCEWNKFHAITFKGGNINSLYNPKMAVQPPESDKYLKNDGSWETKIRPWDDYTHSVDFEMDGEKVNLTISISHTGESDNPEHMESYSLGELNSFIRLSFENPKCFDKIQRYYTVVKSLTAILTMRNNVTFDVYVSQRNAENKYFETGVCKILDHYENYSMRKWHNVIPINSIMDYLPRLIDKISNNETGCLLALLPEDNRRTGLISITNVQDLCTALEVAYNWSKKSKEKDMLIDKLKKNIKNTIAEFVNMHNEIDVYKETTISSAFQYLDYTLKQKILTLYNENSKVVDEIVSKWSLPQVNETSIASFVKLRNNKTHSGTIEWGDNAELYTALLALVYACLLRSVDLSDEIINSVLLQIF